MLQMQGKIQLSPKSTTFNNGRHEFVSSKLFKIYKGTASRKYYENCSCLETSKNNVSYGECCCNNNDCASNICHPQLGYCTTTCNTVDDCVSETVVQNIDAKTCSLSNNLCEVKCPFDSLNLLSPCAYTLSKNDSSSQCSAKDFGSSWVRGKKLGRVNSTIPSKRCIQYIITYCSIISPNDPACKFDAILHIGKEIPKCKQRKPRVEFIGIRATSLISSLKPNHRYLLKISACNNAGCGLNVSIKYPITPLPRIIFSESKQCVVEGKERDSYSVVLNSRPSSPVILSIKGVTNELENMTRKIIFDKGNWSEPVFIQVMALNDNYDDVETLLSSLVHSIVTDDTVYNLHQDYVPSQNISIEIKDNDYSGVLVWNPSVTTSEVGLLGSYNVQLRSRPLHNVSIVMTSGNDIYIYPGVIVLKTDSYDFRKNHTVNVTAVPDHYDDPDIATSIIEHQSLTNDTKYNNIFVPNVSVVVIDDDTAGVILTPNIFDGVGEGERVTYDISLTAQPRTPVLILISLNPIKDGMLARTPIQYINNESLLSFSTTVKVLPDGNVIVLSTALLFDVGKENWMIPKTFTLNIDDDNIDLGEQYSVLIQHVAISDDETFNCKPCDTLIMPVFNVTIDDNDVAGILLSKKNLVVTEDGTRSDSYFIELESAPRSDVIINIHSVANQVKASPSQINFTSFNFMIPQEIKITAINDGIFEDQVHFDTLRYSIASTDLLYKKIIIPSTNLRIIDASAVVDTSPPPSVLSMVQADDIKEINVNFDRPAYVEFIGIEHMQDCNEFFSTRSAKLFGIGAFCYWHSRTQLRVREGTPFEEHVDVGSKLTLLGGVVRSTLTSVIFSEGTYILQGRAPPPVMSYAYYGETGTEIFVNFTGSCYSGFSDIAGGTICATVFQDSSALGDGALCSWVSPCLLRINLGFGSTIKPAFGLSRCGACECKSCLATPAYINYYGYTEKCLTPSYECPVEFCYCAVPKDVSKIVLCPPGRSLRLIPDVIKPIRYSILSASGCIKIDVPPNVVEPVASIKTLLYGSTCRDMTVDGSNSVTSGGGRDNITWSINPIYLSLNSAGSEYRSYFAESLNNISNAASNKQDMRLLIPRDVLLAGFNGGIREVSVNLKIENILGDVSIKSLTIPISDDTNIYPVIFANDTMKVKRSQELVIRGGTSATCGTLLSLK